MAGRIQFLPPSDREEFASKGGKARVAKGVGHMWTADEARAASRKRWQRQYSRDRQERIRQQLAGRTP